MSAPRGSGSGSGLENLVEPAPHTPQLLTLEAEIPDPVVTVPSLGQFQRASWNPSRLAIEGERSFGRLPYDTNFSRCG